MREQLANAHFTRAREVRKVLRDFVIKRQLPLFLEEKNRSRRELFADGADRIPGIDVNRAIFCNVRVAEGFGESQLALLHNGHRDARSPTLRESRGNFAGQFAVQIRGLLRERAKPHGG